MVLNRYQGGFGWGGLGLPVRTFEYVLGTGASWKGRIGRARILCDTRGIRDGGPFLIEPAGYHRRGDRIAWEFRDFKPEKEAQVNIGWIDGFTNVRVNGRPIYARWGWSENWGPVASRREGQEVWLPVRAAAGWLGAKLVVSRTDGAARLERGGRWAALRNGSRRIETAGGPMTLARPAREVSRREGIRGGYLVGPLRPLVRALGGRSSFDRRGSLNVWMPPPPRAAVPPSSPAPKAVLLARYRFDGRVDDLTGRNAPFVLQNTRFQEHALYLNGQYEYGETAGYHAVCKTPGLDYRAFSVAVRLKAEEFAAGKRNLVTGGTSYRWFGLSCSEKGNLTLTLNNQVFRREILNAPLPVGKWMTVACGVNLKTRRVVAYLDGRRVAAFALPGDFRLDVAASQKRESDKNWSFTNYSNGAVFHGLVEALWIYNGVLSEAQARAL